MHDFPCGTPGNKVQAEISLHLHARLSRMAHHRDLAGQYDWIAVDCDRQGVSIPSWKIGVAVRARVADATQ
ncbi:MAG: hypothetical protein ACKPKO_24855, partial [Candidatus Fonsibacter sp.]